jgi:Dolichyl-phosphate-mannose-protein mannosyltransferase
MFAQSSAAPISNTVPHNRALVPVMLIAAIPVALLFAVANQYGYFRDELYYLACAQHPAWGYVDQPPLIAWIAWLVTHTIGDSLFAIRLLPALAIGLSVYLAAQVARELGGGRFAIIAAAILMAVMPLALGIGHLFAMNAFDYPLWLALVLVILRIANTGNARLWLVFGALAGITVLNKYGIIFFFAAFILGIVLTPWRRWLANRWFWRGVLVAILIPLPNFLWQQSHGFPFLELMRNIRHNGRDISPPPLHFLGQQLQIVNPFSFLAVVIGAVWLLRTPRYRAVGIAFVAFYFLLEAMGAKNYYLGPVYPMMFAAAAVALEKATALRARWAAVTLLVLAIAVTLITLPIAIPVLTPDDFVAYTHITHIEQPKFEHQLQGPLPQIYADMFGWPEMVQKTAAFYNTLTPDQKRNTAIWGDNYGVASALTFFGPQYGLPAPIGPHQSFYYWGPRNYRSPDIIELGAHDDDDLRRLCDSVQIVGHADHPLARPSEHFDIYYCRGLHYDLQANWSTLKRFD